jgi:hypothetical protein
MQPSVAHLSLNVDANGLLLLYRRDHLPAQNSHFHPNAVASAARRSTRPVPTRDVAGNVASARSKMLVHLGDLGDDMRLLVVRVTQKDHLEHGCLIILLEQKNKHEERACVCLKKGPSHLGLADWCHLWRRRLCRHQNSEPQQQSPSIR